MQTQKTHRYGMVAAAAALGAVAGCLSLGVPAPPGPAVWLGAGLGALLFGLLAACAAS